MRRVHEAISKNDPSWLAIHDYNDDMFTYGDLERMSSEMAESLKSHGIRGGDRLILVAENCALYACMLLAASKIDAWLILVNARMMPDEIKKIADHSTARAIVFTTCVSSVAQSHADEHNASVISTHDCGDLVVSPVRDTEIEPVDETDQQVASLLYTTGTTGNAKGVMLTHANLLFAGNASMTIRQVTPKDRMVGALPGTHIFSYSSVMLTTFLGGGTIHMIPRFSAENVIDSLKKGATILPAVPQMYALIEKYLREQNIEKLDHKVRYMSSGGAPLDPAWKANIEKIFGISLQNGYGLTETSPGVCSVRSGEHFNDTTVGRPLPGVEVMIHEPNDEGIGEIRVRGPNVMKGYYKNPKATEEAITPDGWFCTGDLGRVTDEGLYYIVGRSKEVIIHSGFNVYPPEMEAVLTEHPDITMAAVVGRSRNSNEDVMAFVATTKPITGREIRDWVYKKVSPYKVPHVVVVTDALPQAATGKVLKNSLLSHFAKEIEEEENKNHA